MRNITCALLIGMASCNLHATASEEFQPNITCAPTSIVLGSLSVQMEQTITGTATDWSGHSEMKFFLGIDDTYMIIVTTDGISCIVAEGVLYPNHTY